MRCTCVCETEKQNEIERQGKRMRCGWGRRDRCVIFNHDIRTRVNVHKGAKEGEGERGKACGMLC